MRLCVLIRTAQAAGDSDPDVIYISDSDDDDNRKLSPLAPGGMMTERGDDNIVPAQHANVSIIIIHRRGEQSSRAGIDYFYRCICLDNDWWKWRRNGRILA